MNADTDADLYSQIDRTLENVQNALRDAARDTEARVAAERERGLKIIEELERKAIGEAQRMEQAVAVERERCAKVAESCIPTGPDPVGPLFGAGIAAAAEHIAKRIRSEK